MMCFLCLRKKEYDAAANRSKEIDFELKSSAEKLKTSVKILLLGAGESGKSTILKQLRIIHCGGFSDSDRLRFKYIVHCNTVQGMLAILRGMGKLQIQFNNSERMEEAQFLFQNAQVVENDREFPVLISRAIALLWQDEGIQECWRRSDEFQLNDSATYFLNALDRISHPDYLPTDSDILRTRVKTTHIVEENFTFRGLNLRMLDVGGQRTEKKKWIHCFEDVMTIIFVAALNEYNVTLWEDNETNRMRESVRLFGSICNNRWFRETSLILFLNKWDIFEKKVAFSSLKASFPDYRGSNSPRESGEYIKRRFEAVNKNTQKEIYSHFTSAIDTENIEHVFDAAVDVILKKNIKNVQPL